MDFLGTLLWGVEVASGYAIDVWNCRARLSRWQGDTLLEAENWRELEDEAIEAIEAFGGAVNLSGLYPCPAELAEKGVWQ